MNLTESMRAFTEETSCLYGDHWWLENPVKKGGGPRVPFNLNIQPNIKIKSSPALFTPSTIPYRLPTKPQEKFSGLVQVYSHRGGPSTLFALECLHKERGLPSPSSYYAFISDEGFLYAPGLQKWNGFLSQFLFVKTKNTVQALSASLEAVKTGLFAWIGLRPSQAPNLVQLRKLQLACEKNQVALFLLAPAKLPSSLFQISFEVAYDQNGKPRAHSVSTRSGPADALSRKLIGAYA